METKVKLVVQSRYDGEIDWGFYSCQYKTEQEGRDAVKSLRDTGAGKYRLVKQIVLTEIIYE